MRDLSSLRATPARTPPPDGLDAVLGEARRRLRNRVAGSTAVVAAAAVLAASLPSSLQSNGMTKLEPAQRPTESAAPVRVDPTGAPVVRPTTRPDRYTVRAQAPAQPRPSRPAGPPEAPAASTQQAAPAPPAAPPAPEREPMDRRHERGGDTGALCVQAGSEPGAPREWCGEIEFDDALSVLTVAACRDRGAITAGALSFADGLEADFTVHDANGILVWRWSDAAARAGSAHQLSYDAGDCYHWTVRTDRFRRHDVTGWTVTGFVHGAELGDENNWSDTAPQD